MKTNLKNRSAQLKQLAEEQSTGYIKEYDKVYKELTVSADLPAALASGGFSLYQILIVLDLLSDVIEKVETEIFTKVAIFSSNKSVN